MTHIALPNTDTQRDVQQRLHWEGVARRLLVGRTIRDVFYASLEDVELMGFQGKRPLVLVLDNGLQILPMSDDEGNDAGAFYVSDEQNDVLPTL